MIDHESYTTIMIKVYFNTHIYRHPDKDERPCFQDIMLMMLKQDKEILSIPEEDVTTHPLAGAIGATLEAGEKMYHKLQMTYS